MNWTKKAVGIALLGVVMWGTSAKAVDTGAAGQDEQKRHAAAMAQGMSHDEARKASTQVKGDEAAGVAVQHRHAKAMAKGASHDEARKASTSAPSGDSARLLEVQKKHAAAMAQGMSHDEARKAAEKN